MAEYIPLHNGRSRCRYLPGQLSSVTDWIQIIATDISEVVSTLDKIPPCLIATDAVS